MKNKLTDLNDHLMAQIERLCEEGLSEEELANEIARSKALAPLASSVIDNAKTILEAAAFVQNNGLKSMPKSLEMLTQ